MDLRRRSIVTLRILWAKEVPPCDGIRRTKEKI